MEQVTRADVRQTAWVVMIVLLLFTSLQGGSAMGGEQIAKIISTQVICKQPGRYIGWPTITKIHTGDILVVFSGDRDAHVCPWGKTQLVRSRDDGKTWTPPVTVNNTPLDDRDAGIIETKKGTLLVSWFTSLAFDNPRQVNWQKLPQSMLQAWKQHTEKLGAETRKQYLGNWVRRSTDGGRTWGGNINSIVTAPHGAIELSGGKLLYVGKNRLVGDANLPLPPEKKLLAAAVSEDDGESWKIAGYIPVPKDAQSGAKEFHEPHAVEIAPGKIVAMFRYHGQPSQYYLWQTESSDGGKNWTTLHPTGIWGYPPHLLRLKDGRILVSYGRRKPPYGERACISRDNGTTWDIKNEITLSSAPNSDLGYPASVQLEDGSIMTVYYQQEKAGEKTCLMTTHWQLSE